MIAGKKCKAGSLPHTGLRRQGSILFYWKIAVPEIKAKDNGCDTKARERRIIGRNLLK